MEQLRLSNGLRIKVKEIYPYGKYIGFDDTPEPSGLPNNVLEEFELNTDSLPKIPSTLFRKLSKFFYDYASKDLEVHARVMYNPTSKEHAVWVPTQTITGSSVNKFDYSVAIDLETGEHCSTPDRNWATLWQFHVHPFHMPGPSGVDDNGFPGQPGTGELDMPGGYGIFSCWRTENKYVSFTLRCNVVVNDGIHSRNKRLPVSTVDIVEGITNGDSIPVYKIEYSDKAHSVVTRYVAPQIPLANQAVARNYSGTALYNYWTTHDASIDSLRNCLKVYTLEDAITALTVLHTKEDILRVLNAVEE